MRSRKLLIAMSCTIYLLQIIYIALSQWVASDATGPLNLLTNALVVVVVTVVDVGVMRYLISALKRAEQAYAGDVSDRLGRSLESYRVEAQREEEFVREIVGGAEEELSQARAALKEGSYDSANTHLRTGLILASRSKAPLCDNVTVSAVLESKKRQCADAGVDLDTRVSIPQKLPVQDIEIAAVFFNLIDNALHECEELPRQEESHNPIIKVRAQTQAGQLFVGVTNPCRLGIEVPSRSANSRQEMASQHGWGTKIVTSIAQEYGGIAEFTKQDSSFVASVMIPLSDSTP